MTACETPIRTLPESIANLDLSILGRKLLEDDAFEAERRHGQRLWDEARVERALQEYKQFLALMLWHPEAVLIPSEDIDEVWHTHVLDTARYQANCETIFGCFQHHLPSSSASAEEQQQQLHGRDETHQLFEEAFGVVPESYRCNDDFKCGRTNASHKCGRMSTRKCGRMDIRKCGRTNTRKCGRMETHKCGRMSTRKCGRVNTESKCGRVNARCGRT
jgi:hypothetical protein